MAKRENNLGSDPIGKLLLRLALPTVTAQLVNALYNIVDRMYIGHMEGVGDLALTGLGVCFPVIMFVSAISAPWWAWAGPPEQWCAWARANRRQPMPSWGIAPRC